MPEGLKARVPVVCGLDLGFNQCTTIHKTNKQQMVSGQD